MRNARFWIWHTGPVKLTLRPGQVLEHSFGYPTDEGSHSEAQSWWIEDGRVERRFASHSVDCDGPLDRYVADSCPLDDLKSGNECTEDSSVVFPDWIPGERSQRDHYAEAAGY